MTATVIDDYNDDDKKHVLFTFRLYFQNLKAKNKIKRINDTSKMSVPLLALTRMHVTLGQASIFNNTGFTVTTLKCLY